MVIEVYTLFFFNIFTTRRFEKQYRNILKYFHHTKMHKIQEKIQLNRTQPLVAHINLFPSRLFIAGAKLYALHRCERAIPFLVLRGTYITTCELGQI